MAYSQQVIFSVIYKWDQKASVFVLVLIKYNQVRTDPASFKKSENSSQETSTLAYFSPAVTDRVGKLYKIET